MLCWLDGQPLYPPCPAPACTEEAGGGLGWAREEGSHGVAFLLGLPCREEVRVDGTEIVIECALKYDVLCVFHPAGKLCCCTVGAEALVTWDPGRPKPAVLLCPPMYSRAQLCHGNPATPLPNLRHVGWQAILIWVQTAGSDDPEVVVQSASTRTVCCLCYPL